MNNDELIFVLIVFFSNIIQSITGFAGNLLAMPASIQLIGIDNAKVVLNVIGLIWCLLMAIHNYRDINKKELLIIVCWMFIGILAGNYLYQKLPLSFLKHFYAVMIIIIAIKGFSLKRKLDIPHWIMPIILLFAGVIHAMFISGGALLVIYVLRRISDKSELRATLTAIWFLLNGYIMVVQVRKHAFTPMNIRLTLLCIPAIIVAILIGNKIHDRINPKAFMFLTNILLLISGVILLI